MLFVDDGMLKQNKKMVKAYLYSTHREIVLFIKMLESYSSSLPEQTMGGITNIELPQNFTVCELLVIIFFENLNEENCDELHMFKR